MLSSIKKLIFILFLSLSFFCSIPAVCFSEYYQYIDKNGVRCFSDDAGSVPETSRDGVLVVKEKYDDLSGEERAERIRRDQKEITRIKQEKSESLKEIDTRRNLEDYERSFITPVIIRYNQILVPVTFASSGKKVTTHLLLDTGASGTMIHDSVARRLNIKNAKPAFTRVAGGGVVKSARAKIDSITVGVRSLHSPVVMIMSHTGPDQSFEGLLGMDFLGRFRYTIDHKNQVIRWIQ